MLYVPTFLSFILCVADLGFIGLYVTLHAQYINTMLIIGHFFTFTVIGQD